MKKFTIVAGVNGAGKSTLYQLDPDLKCENRVNAELLFRQLCALAALSVRMFYVLNIGFAPLPKATGMGKSSCCEHRKV
ncbi:hypothetical protein [Butyrivibrio sp. AE3004]|uniref:hypothetical protein n=1 Tax=Butyrivibrio sp. AE3004 TaxID=1506994 RepID=UPI0004940435|nr:hypothetical protein [Butyrivibrio sp. AE3004]